MPPPATTRRWYWQNLLTVPSDAEALAVFSGSV